MPAQCAPVAYVYENKGSYIELASESNKFYLKTCMTMVMTIATEKCILEEKLVMEYAKAGLTSSSHVFL